VRNSETKSTSNPREADYDIAIIGGGILGVSIAYWLSTIYDCRIALVEKEDRVAGHTSSRNTGMVHRPFYLNPEKKKLFARASQKSYFLWRELATRYGLTWKPMGTLEVAMDEGQVKTLDQYLSWAMQNGMRDEEVEVLDQAQAKSLEPEVNCAGAIHSKTDTCVDYGEFTNFLFEKSLKNGIKFIGGSSAEDIDSRDDLNRIALRQKGKNQTIQISAEFVVNAAGGGSIDIAHKLGLAKEYTDLHFRGEYWLVEEPFASKVSRNIYSVARFKEYPFLDPHLIVRASGLREIGPNAVLVSSPWAYKGLSEKRLQILQKMFERPIYPKLKLFTSGMFLSLVLHEWRSSISKKAMCARVSAFLPSLKATYLVQRGMSGIRSSVIDKYGFVPEALLLDGNKSLHVLNFNSPGATGAPSFSAYVVSKIMDSGNFDRLKKKKSQIDDNFWKFEDAADLV
jgi:(S)-2-hydroxyglutarate dehydrogenase